MDTSKISPLQFSILLTGFLLGSSLLFPPGESAVQHAWLVVIISFGVGLLLAWGYTAIGNRFPGKTLIEINNLIYGPYLGKIISVLYLWFLFHGASLTLRDFSDYFNTAMPRTPMVIIMIFMMLVCSAAVRQGVEVIARCSLILVPIAIATFLFFTALSSQLMDLNHFLPLWPVDLRKLGMASLGATTFPFGQSIVFLMCFFAITQRHNSRKAWAAGILIAGLMLTIISLRNIAVLGEIGQVFNWPSHTVVRLIEVGEILTRLDFLLAVQFFTMGFLKISVLLYAVSLGTAQLFRMSYYTPIVLPLGALIINLSILQFESLLQNFQFAHEIYPFYAIPFEFLIPFITLILALKYKPQLAQGETL